jgi:hypothetical protein
MIIAYFLFLGKTGRLMKIVYMQIIRMRRQAIFPRRTDIRDHVDRWFHGTGRKRRRDGVIRRS